MQNTMDPANPGTELTALLGRGTSFEGKLYFNGRLRIDGTFRGEIRSEDVLVIGEGADVQAEIDVDTVIVRGGVVTGNIRARAAIELYVPARVVGNLRSPSIFIDKGVKVEGSCTMAPVDPTETEREAAGSP
jgi:cytoskeletal protein CcmA (bactofilin family)